MEDKTLQASALAELLELAARSLHSMGYAEGLYPAQWTALRYFAKADDGVKTASELARFQGLANGPVSRTVRTLIGKGLLQKSDNQPVGRAEHLEVTAEGRSFLSRDPIGKVIATIEDMPAGDRTRFATMLEAVIRAASSVWQRSEPTEAR